MLCPHLAALDVAHLRHDTHHVCPAYVALGATWVHLRVYQACGHAGCCDSSPNKHATQHYRASQHSVITSAEPGEQWAGCYPDQALVKW